MATYNGHKNYEYWNISLWINNDEGLYLMAKDCVRHNKSKNLAAKAMLDRLIKGGLEKTPDGIFYTIPSIMAAMTDM